MRKAESGHVFIFMLMLLFSGHAMLRDVQKHPAEASPHLLKAPSADTFPPSLILEWWQIRI